MSVYLYLLREEAEKALEGKIMAEKEYIEREAAKGCVKEHYDDAIIIALDNIPAADVRPVVHGHWVYEEPNGANSFKGAYWCDKCHQPESYRKNFCPNCGADMDGGVNDGRD